MKKILLFISVFMLCVLSFSSPVFAFTTKGGEDLSISESIEDDVYAFGNTVTLTGNVDGDLVAAGSQINILGNVEGDLLAAGSTITVNGEIGDTVRIAGGVITINNNLKKDLVAAGGQVEISSNSVIDGDVAINAARIVINGNVGGGLKVSAAEVTINGKIGDTVEISSSNIKIGDGAEISGNLNYTSDKEALVSANAKITGKTNWTKPKTDSSKELKVAPNINKGAVALFTATWIGGKAVRFLSCFVLGIILLLVAPWAFSKFNARMKKSFGYCVGGGAIVLFGAPIAMFIIFIIGIILFVTIIGSLLGVLSLFANFYLILGYALLLFVSNIFLSFFIGNLILQKGVKNLNKYGWKVVALLIGLVITSILFAIPFIGWLAQFVAILFGFGGLVMIIKDWIVSFRKARIT